MARFAIFEPWGLGDVCIAMDLARRFSNAGHEVIIICNPSWSDWAASQPFIHGVLPFFAPWTSKRSKYDPRKYHLKLIFKFGHDLRKLRVDAIIDLRSDPRNAVFLSLLSHSRIVTPGTSKITNRYSRPLEICKKLNISVYPHALQHKGTPNLIACSFEAGWKNRDLPQAKCLELVRKLLELNYKTLILIPPQSDIGIWRQLTADFPLKIEVICTDLISMSERLRTAQLCIAVDSGIMHLAHFYDVPTVALFGFSNFPEWLPPTATLVTSEEVYSIREQFILAKEQNQPLKTLDVDLVIQTVQKLSKT